jgi:hypothetical protein
MTERAEPTDGDLRRLSSGIKQGGDEGLGLEGEEIVG